MAPARAPARALARALRLSPLRFAGSKARCLDALDAQFQEMGLQPGGFTYYEPMCGSLTVGLHVLDRYKPREAHIADASPDIINFFVQLRSHYKELSQEIRTLAGGGLDEHAYYELRRRFNQKCDPPLTAAAQFYLLNRACFNGVYRVNGLGYYNVPFGKFADGVCAVTPQMWAQLHRAHLTLASSVVHFACVDVEAFLMRVPPDDTPHLLYCDPPYVQTDRSLYQPQGQFDIHKHARVCQLYARWPGHVAVTNSGCTAVMQLHKQWKAIPLASERSVSASAESRGVGGPCAEVLFVRA